LGPEEISGRRIWEVENDKIALHATPPEIPVFVRETCPGFFSVFLSTENHI
jgi:hypothetical protein